MRVHVESEEIVMDYSYHADPAACPNVTFLGG